MMKTGKFVFPLMRMGLPASILLALLLSIGCGDSGGGTSGSNNDSIVENQAPSIDSVYITGDAILNISNGVITDAGTEFELDENDEPVIRDISGIVLVNADVDDPDDDPLTTSFEYKIEESGTWTGIDANGLNLRDIDFADKSIYVKAVTSDGEQATEAQRSFYVDENDIPTGADDNTEYHVSVGDDSPALPLSATDAEEDILTFDIYKDGALYAEGISGTSYTPAGLPEGTHVFTAIPMDTDAGLEYVIGKVVVNTAGQNPPVVESVVFKSVVHLGLAGAEDHNLGSETVIRDISGIVEVVAKITDADEDIARVLLKYSTDEGSTWNEIAADGDGKYFIDLGILGGIPLLFSVYAADATGLEDMLQDDLNVDLNEGFIIENDGTFIRGTYTRTEWTTSKTFTLPVYAETDSDEGDNFTIYLRKDDIILQEVTPGGTYTTHRVLGRVCL
jgi:hypothetical protein